MPSLIAVMTGRSAVGFSRRRKLAICSSCQRPEGSSGCALRSEALFDAGDDVFVLDELASIRLLDAQPDLSHELSLVSERSGDDLFDYLSRRLTGAGRPSGDFGFNLW
jgi:hypothetical protein